MRKINKKNQNQTTTLTVDDYFDTYEEECLIKYMKKDHSGNYYYNLYEKYKDKFKLTWEEFCTKVIGFSPGKHGIGQKSQISCLQDKNKNIHKLPNNGEQSIRFFNNKIQYGGKSIKGTKSIDAKLETDDSITLFMLKTTDIGNLSTNIGGGNQGNVKNEFYATIDVIKNLDNNSIFNNKQLKFAIIINGRNSKNTINDLQKYASSIKNLVIYTAENFTI